MTQNGLYRAGSIVMLVGLIVLFAFGFLHPGKAEMGFAMVMGLVGVLTVLQAVNGVALKKMVDQWASAPAQERSAAFRAAEAVRGIEQGLDTYYYLLKGITFIFFSPAMLVGSGYPKWLGVVGLLGSVGHIAAGMVIGTVGFGPTAQSIAPLSLLLYVWFLITGIWLGWKSIEASRPVANPAHPMSSV